MYSFLKPAPTIDRLPKDKINSTYKKLRIQVYLGIFIGYAAYYLVRNNFALIMPNLNEMGYTKGQLGLVMSATSLTYGLSKFLMGSISDRSNPKYFLVLGLVFSSLIMGFMGLSPLGVASLSIMIILMALNGWVQGMGWPPCGRTMVHWFSTKERGTIVGTWNVAHNIGGGLVANIGMLGVIYFAQWQAILYFPALIAFIIAILVFFLMKDTPQSCGLPPIEEFKNDYPPNYDSKNEEELSAKEIFFTYVLKNKFLWYIAIANVFVYLIRYGAVNWAPTYLKQVKGFSIAKSSLAYAFYEYSAIVGTVLCGYISDKVFKGNRAPAGILFMIGVLISVIMYYTSTNNTVITISLIMIGFFIYGPVMLIGLHALDLVPKKAAGTAAGFTGLFGYVGGSVMAGWLVGYIIDNVSWDGYFIFMIISCIASMIFMGLTLFGKNNTTH